MQKYAYGFFYVKNEGRIQPLEKQEEEPDF
jgi:hypothetical protein